MVPVGFWLILPCTPGGVLLHTHSRMHVLTFLSVRPVDALRTVCEYVYLYVGVYVVDVWCRLASSSCSPVHLGGVLLHTHSHMHVLTFGAARGRPDDGM